MNPYQNAFNQALASNLGNAYYLQQAQNLGQAYMQANRTLGRLYDQSNAAQHPAHEPYRNRLSVIRAMGFGGKVRRVSVRGDA